jgi:hypothetical protein
MPCVLPAAYFAVSLTSAPVAERPSFFGLAHEEPRPDEHPLQSAPYGFTVSSGAPTPSPVIYGRTADAEFAMPAPVEPGAAGLEWWIKRLSMPIDIREPWRDPRVSAAPWPSV